jgi:hypothetical protein
MSMRVTCLLAAALLLLLPASAASAAGSKYTIGDLEALVRSSSWSELLHRSGERARLRLDGARSDVALRGRPGPLGRTDYLRAYGGVLLHLMRDGRVRVFHRERPDGVWVTRDSDADPL